MTWLGAFSQERQILWLPKEDLKDPSTWSSPPLVLLHDIHDGLLDNWGGTVSPSLSRDSGTRTRVVRSQQDGDVQKQEVDPLLLP